MKPSTRRGFLQSGLIAAAGTAIGASGGGLYLSGPSSATVEQGKSVALTLQLKRQGKPQAATFSIMGLPSGVTASFKPTSCLPNCQTVLTLSAASTTTPGPYSVTIRAQSAKDTAFMSLLVTVAPSMPLPPPPPPDTYDYYVSASGGSDSYNGLAPAFVSGTTGPKATFTAGVALLSAGKTLGVRTGTYTTGVQLEGYIGGGGTSWANPVKIKAYQGETVTLRPTNTGWTIVMLERSLEKYIIFDGLIFDGNNQSDNCIVTSYTTVQSNCPSYIRFINCEIKNSVGQGFLLSDHGLGGHHEIINCLIHDNGSSEFDHGIYNATNYVLVEHCDIYGNLGYGIQQYTQTSGDQAHGCIYRYNKVHDNNFSQVVLGGGTDIKFYNNLIWGAGEAGIKIAYDDPTDVVVYNNSFWTLGMTNAWDVLTTSVNTVLRNNIFYPVTGTLDEGSGTINTDNLYSNPTWLSTTPGDADFLKIGSGSAARNAGANLSPTVVDDFIGTTRPKGAAYDIGAYEYIE